MSAVELNINKISELRVVDLRAELEKRGLSKNGNKAELIDRLVVAVQQGAPNVMDLSSNAADSEKTNESAQIVEEAQDVSLAKEIEPGTENDQSQLSEDELQQITISGTGEIQEKNFQEDNPDTTKEDNDTSRQPPDSSEDLPQIKLSSHIFEESTNESAVENENVDAVKPESGFTGRLQQDMSGTDEDVLIVDAGGSSNIDQEPESTQEDGKMTSDGESVATEKLTSDLEIEETSKSTKDESKTGPNASGEKGSPKVSEDKKAEVRTGSPSKSNVQTLVVSGFASTTRASDIREAFRRFGKISGVKIISNSRAEGSTRFAHVTISTTDDAAACIEELNNSELHGNTVTVSRVRGNAMDFVKELNAQRNNSSSTTEAASQKASSTAGDGGATGASGETPAGESRTLNAEGGSSSGKKSDTGEVSKDRKEEPKKSATHIEKLEAKVVSTDKRSEKATSSSSRHETKHRDDSKHRSDRTSSRDERSHRPVHHHRNVEVRLRSPNFRPYEGGRTYYSGHSASRSFRGPPYDRPDRSEHRLTFEKIRERREEAARRELERKQREYRQNKLREEEERQRAIERRNEHELRKLEEEREKLRREREKVEREKQELIRLEKLRQQHERERIEKEKEELRRAQMKLAQKRSLGGEKDRARYDEYPDVKRSHVEGHRIAPSSHSQPEFSRRSPRQESSRKVEAGRHEREALRVEVDFGDRARARPREREHGHSSSSGDKRVEPRARDKPQEYALPRAPKPPIIGKTVERVSRDFERKEYPAHGSISRSEVYRAPEPAVDPWGRNSYAAAPPSGQQSAGRAVWASSSSRKAPPVVSNDRQVRVEPTLDRWGANNAPAAGYMNRASPSLLNQHVINPHAGRLDIGGALPVANSGFNPYKVPQGQFRRY